jgi:hypothetical protein
LLAVQRRYPTNTRPPIRSDKGRGSSKAPGQPSTKSTVPLESAGCSRDLHGCWESTRSQVVRRIQRPEENGSQSQLLSGSARKLDGLRNPCRIDAQWPESDLKNSAIVCKKEILNQSVCIVLSRAAGGLDAEKSVGSATNSENLLSLPPAIVIMPQEASNFR